MKHPKSKRSKRTRTDRRKSARSGAMHDERQTTPLGYSAFRLLAWQPLSLTLEDPRPFDLSLRQLRCRLAIRPAEQDEFAQLARGGSFIAIDFHLSTATDLLVAVYTGVKLVEDFLSATALVEGATLRSIEPIQIVRADQTTSNKYTFVRFLQLQYNHWETPIPLTTIDHVRRLVAHWDGLDTGTRLRRAARQFRQAIGTPDDLTAFQHAYIGLEAMEKPLAQAAGIPPGVEEAQGACTNCGEPYTRRRTVLAGVRAYVHGAVHPATVSSQRKREWRQLSRLRQDLFHGLADTPALERRAQTTLPAAMHYLHDAICCQSHTHTLESPGFRLARGTRQVIMVGEFTADGLGPLENWTPLLGTQEMQWVRHDRHRFVPELRLDNPGYRDLRARFFWHTGPLSAASEANLQPAEFESG